MERLNSRSRVIFTTISAFLGWFAVVAQLYLILKNKDVAVTDSLLQFFSYFTILTNILVAFTFTILVTKQQSSLKSFLSQPQTLTAIGVYIFVVGLIYNFVLRQLWAPSGLQRIVDELLHLFIPLLYLIYWFLFVPKKGLQWKDSVVWLIYPLAYLLLILTHGHFTGFYPYPFVNVPELGYEQVLYNSGVIMMLFILLSLGFIGIGRLTGKKD